MNPYVLKVFFPGEQKPREVVKIDRASDVLALIPQLVGRHEGCHRVQVCLHDRPLFSVDCHGNDVSD